MNKVPIITDDSHIIKVQESTKNKVIVIDNDADNVKVSLAMTTI